jgi:hypothetical protein
MTEVIDDPAPPRVISCCPFARFLRTWGCCASDLVQSDSAVCPSQGVDAAHLVVSELPCKVPATAATTQCGSDTPDRQQQHRAGLPRGLRLMLPVGRAHTGDKQTTTKAGPGPGPARLCLPALKFRLGHVSCQPGHLPPGGSAKIHTAGPESAEP